MKYLISITRSTSDTASIIYAGEVTADQAIDLMVQGRAIKAEQKEEETGKPVVVKESKPKKKKRRVIRCRKCNEEGHTYWTCQNIERVELSEGDDAEEAAPQLHANTGIAVAYQNRINEMIKNSFTVEQIGREMNDKLTKDELTRAIDYALTL